jgi:hypothetical protein
MKHHFGDTEIGDIWRENIVTSFWMQITTHSKASYKRSFVCNNAVSDVLVFCQQKHIVTDGPGSKPHQR